MKHSLDTYSQYDPYEFSDRDVDVRHRTTKIVKTRAQHVCVPPINGKPHDIPSGSMAWRETAIVEGIRSSCYVCLPHMDEFIEEVSGD